MKLREYGPALLAVSLAAVVLWITCFAFDGLAAQRRQTELEETLRRLLPGSTSFREKVGDGGLVHALYEGETGTVAQVSCPGYVYDVELLVAVGQEGYVTGLVVRDAHETPFLGSAILTDHEFLAQLLTTAGQAEIGEEIRPITGATVSSRAVVRCVNAAVSAVTGVDVPSQATPWEGTP